MDDLMSTPACTLPTLERPLRLAEFDDVFRMASEIQYDGTTASMRLFGPPTLLETVLDLTRRESACCSFFAFTVSGSDSEVDLVVAAPAEHQAIVAALANRAQEMGR